MVLKCPKCNHPRSPNASEQTVCSACGLVFAKWVQRVLGQEDLPARGADAVTDREDSTVARVGRWLFPIVDRVDPIVFYGRCVLFVVFLLWGLYFIALDLRSNEIGASFMHRINLIFHEAGHVLFMPFGSFMMVLGGTLGQLLMPIVAGVALLWTNRDAFGASLALWWLGQSMMDCAPYINDARDLQLMLLGGGTGADRPGMHDWENILLDLNMIQHERGIALAADRLGELLLLLGLAWGARVLWMQHQALQRKSNG